MTEFEREREGSAHRPNPFSEINSSRNVSLSHGPTIYLLTQLSLPFPLSFYISNELEWYGRGARVSSDRPLHRAWSSCGVKTHKQCVSPSTVPVSANTHTHPTPSSSPSPLLSLTNLLYCSLPLFLFHLFFFLSEFYLIHFIFRCPLLAVAPLTVIYRGWLLCQTMHISGSCYRCSFLLK